MDMFETFMVGVLVDYQNKVASQAAIIAELRELLRECGYNLQAAGEDQSVLSRIDAALKTSEPT